jgi:hypothetical protein
VTVPRVASDIIFFKSVSFSKFKFFHIFFCVFSKVNSLGWEDDMNLWEELEGKAVPLQVWTGPESSRRLRLPDF